jgi:predicted enzyme related to lactoylglutathione lyase
VVPAGQFCWVDLAATDASRAIDYYRGLFGWSACLHRANGGCLARLAHRGQEVGSVYQLGERLREAGVASHWTSYVRVEDVDDASRRASALGGSVVVEPFTVEGIALVVDPVGAAFGLWENPQDR